jgi:hypothetical protein
MAAFCAVNKREFFAVAGQTIHSFAGQEPRGAQDVPMIWRTERFGSDEDPE